jgi:hypothetical protein
MTRYAPLWEQANTYAASLDRRAIAALAGGAYPLVNGCAVTVAAGTMNMNIAAGWVIVPSQNNTGSTLCVSDAVETVTSPTAPASGTNRIDVVVCQARGNDLDGGTNNDWLFQVVAGTAAASPTVPATPAGAVAIAQITVIGGAASLAAGNLLDRRILQPWPAPWGHVTSSSSTAGTGSITTTMTDINGMNVSYAQIANRKYKVSGLFEVTSTANGDFGVFQFRDGANTNLGPRITGQLLTGATTWQGFYLENAPATFTTVTRKGSLVRAVGSGILTVTGGQVAQLVVEDIGPAGAPVL